MKFTPARRPKVRRAFEGSAAGAFIPQQPALYFRGAASPGLRKKCAPSSSPSPLTFAASKKRTAAGGLLGEDELTHAQKRRRTKSAIKRAKKSGEGSLAVVPRKKGGRKNHEQQAGGKAASTRDVFAQLAAEQEQKRASKP